MKIKNQLEEERENIVEECLEDIRNQMRLNTSKINQYKGKKYIHKEYRISSNQIGKLRYFIDKVYKRATLTQTNEIIKLVEIKIKYWKTEIKRMKKEDEDKRLIGCVQVTINEFEELLTKIKGDKK